jgi:DNA repair exonuclease SbcCD ATPase subunit
MSSFALLKAADALIGDYDKKLMDLKQMENEIESMKKKRDELIPHGQLLEEVRIFMQTLAKVARAEMMEGLQTAGTMGLQFVFGPDLTFEIEIDTKRNNTAIEFYVVDTSGEEVVRKKPEDNMGGGVVDSLAIGMRYGMLKVRKPSPIGPMILDEPAKMVSSDLVPNISELIKTLTKIFKKQTIFVTHHEQLMDVEHTIHFQKKKGITIINVLRFAPREIEENLVQAAAATEGSATE